MQIFAVFFRRIANLLPHLPYIIIQLVYILVFIKFVALGLYWRISDVIQILGKAALAVS